MPGMTFWTCAAPSAEPVAGYRRQRRSPHEDLAPDRSVGSATYASRSNDAMHRLAYRENSQEATTLLAGMQHAYDGTFRTIPSAAGDPGNRLRWRW